MYFPYLRGRQFELLAIRELIEKGLISEKVVPIIEPVKVSATLLKTIEVAEKKGKAIALITNPKVGSFLNNLKDIKNESFYSAYSQLLSDSKKLIFTRILDDNSSELKDFLELYSHSFMTICLNKDMISNYESFIKDSNSLYNLIPDETGYRRKIRENRVMIADRFVKLERNVDYADKDDYFSDDHLYYQDDGYLGFSDFSIVGNEYSETGFAPYAVAIHIVYFNEKKELRIIHFVSDSNDDITDIAGKFKEAMEKLVRWNSKSKIESYGLNKLIEFYNNESYPGLGTVKKLCIMHHLELMNSYLSEV